MSAVGTLERSTQAPVAYKMPPEVVREAIVNAVAHRDYTSSGSVQVMLFSDRLEVWNPGTLPPSLTLAQLRQPHGSVPGNPLLAEPLYLTQYIERMGTGTGDMIEHCRTAGLRGPEFRCERTGLWVEFSYPVIQMDSATPGTGGSGGVTTQKILAMLARNPSFSRREIAEELGDISENGVKYHLEKLKASGRIRRLGADKGGHWEVLK